MQLKSIKFTLLEFILAALCFLLMAVCIGFSIELARIGDAVGIKTGISRQLEHELETCEITSKQPCVIKATTVAPCPSIVSLNTAEV